MNHQYVVEPMPDDPGRYTGRTAAYAYRILEPNGREIVAYHWHPTGESAITRPHMHLSSRMPAIDLGPRFDPVVLAEMHLPTGRIRLADVVRLLIEEFGVAPQRPDWQAVLTSDGG